MDYDKKIDRKKKRFAARLLSSKGIVCTDEYGPVSTNNVGVYAHYNIADNKSNFYFVIFQNVVLCNAGQATGLEKKQIIQLVSDLAPDIKIPKYIAMKGESHSFLVFSQVEDAVIFCKSYDGKIKIDENGTMLYISFVHSGKTMFFK